MTTPATTAASRPPSRLFIVLRAFRFLALLVAASVAGILLLYAVENWRGKRAWTAERERLVAKGIRIDYDSLVPAPVADDNKNFAMLPVLEPLFDYGRNPENRWQDKAGFDAAMSLFKIDFKGADSKGPTGREWPGGKPTDLEAWQDYYRYASSVPVRTKQDDDGRPLALPPERQTPARDVLSALSTFDADFALIASGLRDRPQSRFPIHYREGYAALLPHLALMKRATSQFSLRASARLADGQLDGAYEDTIAALRLSQTVRDEPTIISQLVQLACLDLAIQPVWEAIQAHAWKDGQLADLQARFNAVEFVPAWRRSLEAERVAIAQIIDDAAAGIEGRKALEGILQFSPQDSSDNPVLPINEVYLLLAPRGWFYASLAEGSKTIEALQDSTMADVPRIRESVQPVRDPNSLRLALYNNLFGRPLAGSSMAANFVKMAKGEAHALLGATACALERDRLVRGQYTDSLDALVPKYLKAVPVDSIDGKPLRYRKTPEGHFRLWSVGENGKDDNGEFPAGRADIIKSAPPETGDWVWGG